MLVARALRDAGFEVIYLGPRQPPLAIARSVVDEDADVLGLSILTGGHLTHTERVLAALRELQADNVPVVVGGIIPARAAEQLEAIGVAAVFGPGDSLREIVERIDRLVPRQGASRSRRAHA
jgi:methylmalonyl-CoA mutase C-terminal domain/subunit